MDLFRICLKKKRTDNFFINHGIGVWIQQFEILKLQSGGSGPMFQIIEYAEIPEMKSGPSRGKLCIIVTFAAFFFSIFIVFVKEAWNNLKKDPENMRKLKGLG